MCCLYWVHVFGSIFHSIPSSPHWRTVWFFVRGLSPGTWPGQAAHCLFNCCYYSLSIFVWALGKLKLPVSSRPWFELVIVPPAAPFLHYILCCLSRILSNLSPQLMSMCCVFSHCFLLLSPIKKKLKISLSSMQRQVEVCVLLFFGYTSSASAYLCKQVKVIYAAKYPNLTKKTCHRKRVLHSCPSCGPQFM